MRRPVCLGRYIMAPATLLLDTSGELTWRGSASLVSSSLSPATRGLAGHDVSSVTPSSGRWSSWPRLSKPLPRPRSRPPGRPHHERRRPATRSICSWSGYSTTAMRPGAVLETSSCARPRPSSSRPHSGFRLPGSDTNMSGMSGTTWWCGVRCGSMASRSARRRGGNTKKTGCGKSAVVAGTAGAASSAAGARRTTLRSRSSGRGLRR